jgi:hypothetical protein
MYWEQASMIGYVGFSFVMAYIAMSLDAEHIIAKVFFLFTSFFTMLFGSRAISQILVASGATEAQQMTADGFFWLMTFITIILFIYLLFYVFAALGKPLYENARSMMRFNK